MTDNGTPVVIHLPLHLYIISSHIYSIYKGRGGWMGCGWVGVFWIGVLT